MNHNKNWKEVERRLTGIPPPHRPQGLPFIPNRPQVLPFTGPTPTIFRNPFATPDLKPNIHHEEPNSAKRQADEIEDKTQEHNKIHRAKKAKLLSAEEEQERMSREVAFLKAKIIQNAQNDPNYNTEPYMDPATLLNQELLDLDLDQSNAPVDMNNNATAQRKFRN